MAVKQNMKCYIGLVSLNFLLFKFRTLNRDVTAWNAFSCVVSNFVKLEKVEREKTY